jgi:hypothetical protein
MEYHGISCIFHSPLLVLWHNVVNITTDARSEAMSVSLIPRDELTLDLLAEVLAKMYRHSLNSGHHTVGETFKTELIASPAGPERRSLSRVTPEPDLVQVKTVQAMSNKHNPAMPG